ncbi:MAG: SUF system Fe-S cluster assembly regulator [Acetobacteraceae bacterium]|nr:SUF system Fe-S cluster assembly regulator [Acetobacteraceae bacterium]
MLRLSKLTDYAVLVLARMGEPGPQPALQTAPGLAGRTGLPEPTVAKVLKILAQSGLVEGLRGAKGGYRLVKPLPDIRLSEVVVAFDGPIALTACVEGGDGSCSAEAGCPVRGRWDPVNAAIRNALAGITIADLAGPEATPRPFIPDPELSLAAE